MEIEDAPLRGSSVADHRLREGAPDAPAGSYLTDNQWSRQLWRSSSAASRWVRVAEES